MVPRETNGCVSRKFFTLHGLVKSLPNHGRPVGIECCVRIEDVESKFLKLQTTGLVTAQQTASEVTGAAIHGENAGYGHREGACVFQ
jgi:hypothetical protein